MAEKAAKKKDGGIQKFFGRIVRSFRNTKGEIKKVVWPTRKQVINNLIVVLVFVVACALFIFLLDLLFSWLLGLVLDFGATLGG